MDDLRSLEGTHKLLKNDKVKNKPKINRANSFLPTAKTKGLLDVINSSDTDYLSARSYSSRGQSVAKIAESLELPNDNKNNKSKNTNTNDNLSKNKSKKKKDINISEEVAEEYEDASKFLSIANYDSNELLSGVSLRAMGLGSIGLNMNDIDDEEEESYNDDGYFNIVDDYNNINECKDESQILNIKRFPIEEFKNYPANTSDNKDNATKECIIGTGGFGIVLKSFHLSSCQTVAIKQCRISDDKKLLKLFIDEAEYYEKFINNPCIIDICGFGRNGNNNKLCIALEYMDLQSILSIDYKLEEIQLKYICFAILSAMDSIHQFNICHNDIKPDNILINSYGQVKLSDFGVCTTMKNNNDLIDNICGSKQYYPPEKWLISPPKYNTKCDIFSFGITFYELITLNMNHNREFGYSEPPNIDNLLDKYSNNLCNCLSKMIIWDYKQRWNAKQLLNHQFLTPANKIKPKPFVEKVIKKEKDLQFMIDSLVEYYSNKNWMDNTDEKQYNDNEKINNLCKHSGCTEKEITTMIKFAVGKVKKQIHKLSTKH